MDLVSALRIAQSSAHFGGSSGPSERDLADLGLLRSTGAEVPMLHGGMLVQPVHLLLHLAYATRLNYERTVLDAYSQWALLRYLGVFDHGLPNMFGPPWLQLSDAGRRITGNQRRVLSEDLGIGMSSVLAREWAATRFGGGVMHLIDVDVATEAGLMPATSGKRTDYLVVEPDLTEGTVTFHGLVESKGTNTASYARRQVTTGAEQIERTWDLPFPELPGLVAATHSGRDGMEYFAAAVEPDEPASDVTVPLDSQAGRDVLSGTWAALADVADDDHLYERVAPPSKKSRRGTNFRQRPLPTHLQVTGRDYEGTHAWIPLPGGTLHVFLGADSAILDNLREERPDAAVETFLEAAQDARRKKTAREEAGRPLPSRLMNDYAGAERVEAVSEDGVALVLEAS